MMVKLSESGKKRTSPDNDASSVNVPPLTRQIIETRVTDVPATGLMRVNKQL